MEKRPSFPGIVCDIDGVLILDKHPIPISAKVVQYLKGRLKSIDPEAFADNDSDLPFVCLTNGGGMLESAKAESLNAILGLKDNPERLYGHDILLNFSALRPIMREYHDRLVILTGNGTTSTMAQDFGLNKYITMEEYATLYGAQVPVSGRPRAGPIVDEMRKKIADRLEITDYSIFDQPLQIHAIFILNDPLEWYEYVQIICDLLTTSDGIVADKLPEQVPEKHIPIYCTNNDLVYAGTFKLPRITLGGFNETLKNIYKLLYKREMEMQHYGKPFEATYKYAEKYLREKSGVDLTNIYMVGDNPKSDIRGAKAAGWKTILVETGVFKKSEERQNDPEDPADYVVKDVREAIKLIFSLEGIKCELL